MSGTVLSCGVGMCTYAFRSCRIGRGGTPDERALGWHEAASGPGAIAQRLARCRLR